MSELRYPNESRAYRAARDALLKDEQELVDKVKSVAEKRRKLPPGGQLKEDYVFQWANDGTELPANHVDTVWPYWNLMDFTPEGRPDIATPPQNFRSEFLEKNYLNNGRP
jgi:predicted dithiol-disulfide oxidoreductase (DUF899 family)